MIETLNVDFGKTIVMVTHDPRAAHRAHIERHLEKGVLSRRIERHRPYPAHLPTCPPCLERDEVLPYVLKHLRRSLPRTPSTVMGMALCIFLICVLQTVLDAMEDRRPTRRAGSPGHASRGHWCSTCRTPTDRESRRSLASAVTPMIFFGGLPRCFAADFANFFVNFAVEAETYFAMYPGYGVPPEQMEAYVADRRGASWDEPWPTIRLDAGQHVPARELHSAVPRWPAVRVRRRGIFDADEARYPGTNETQMFFHYRYLYEATRQRVGVGTFMVQVTDPERAAAVALAIDDAFENSDAQTKTESRQRSSRASRSWPATSWRC